MPSVVIKLYSVLYKALLKHKLLSFADDSASHQLSASDDAAASSRVSGGVPANASFSDSGVATKDIHIDPPSSLSLRIFLPDSALPQHQDKTGLFEFINHKGSDADTESSARHPNTNPSLRRSSYAGEFARQGDGNNTNPRRNSYGGEAFLRSRLPATHKYSIIDHRDNQSHQLAEAMVDDLSDAVPSPGTALHSSSSISADHRHPPTYCGYLPDLSVGSHKKLPIIIQFHGGAFVSGSKDSAANDTFCRRIAKLCDAIVIAVGYRLAPEHRYPAAFDDGFEALSWLAKQANLAECSKSVGHVPSGFTRNGSDIHRTDLHRELVDSFGGSDIVEPWLAAHGDPTRCVLLGVSCGANIANFVSRQAFLFGKLLDPVRIVAQVLMYPFFLGSIPTHSEIKLANTYFFDKATCILAWKLFLPDGQFDLDHPAANPLIDNCDPALKNTPPTLTIVGELDWMKDRAIAYSESLRRAKRDAPVLEYKDAVHEFATLDFLVRSKQAEACAEDMVIWIKKHVSRRGHEFSY